MNTHDIEIELPPLPNYRIYRAGELMNDTPVLAIEAAKDYTRAAIEADRKRRGEPVAVVKDNPHCPEGTSDEISKYLPIGMKLYATPQPAEPVKVPSDPAVAAIQFALETDEAIPFLHCWNEGNFDAIRREWPEAPEAVFIGADPMHPGTRTLLARYGRQPANPTEVK